MRVCVCIINTRVYRNNNTTVALCFFVAHNIIILYTFHRRVIDFIRLRRGGGGGRSRTIRFQWRSRAPPPTGVCNGVRGVRPCYLCVYIYRTYISTRRIVTEGFHAPKGFQTFYSYYYLRADVLFFPPPNPFSAADYATTARPAPPSPQQPLQLSGRELCLLNSIITAFDPPPLPYLRHRTVSFRISGPRASRLFGYTYCRRVDSSRASF